MSKIHLKNVRLSFPSLFQKEIYKGTPTNKYCATFLISKDDKELKDLLDKDAQRLCTENNLKIPKSKICIRDGDHEDHEDHEELHGHWLIKASNKKRPIVIGGGANGKDVITDEDDKFYAGCYVNAIIDFWPQDNKFGKRINANLYGVQFVKDGDEFSSVESIDADEFDDIETTDDGLGD